MCHANGIVTHTFSISGAAITKGRMKHWSFELDIELFISLPICRTLSFSHAASSKIFNSFSWNFLCVYKVGFRTRLSFDLEVKEPSEASLRKLKGHAMMPSEAMLHIF